MKCSLIFIPILLFITFCFGQKNMNGNFQVNGKTREYIVHLPSSYKNSSHFPLVLVFHGGGGNAKQMQGYMGMDPIADQEGFVTVYPQGLNKQWNDGREFDQKIAANDDVQFIQQLLDTVSKNYSIDKKRIFSTGISNGGFFSIYLSYKLSNRLLGVAPVCASIPQKLFDIFYPEHPISILLMNGTKDPLVPYEGGDVGNKLTGSRGACMSTDTTVKRYIQIDGVSAQPKISELPNNNLWDGCTATRYEYLNGKENTKVVFVKVVNGGHTLPGGSQYLPKFIIGKVCNDFKGNQAIWQFFKDCKPRL